MEAIELIDTGDKVGDSPDEQKAAWKEFCDKMPEDKGRFAVFDLRWQQDDGRKRDSVCFVAWTPDSCGVRQRMQYASSQEAFKGSLEGIKSTIVAHDQSDLNDSREEIITK